jgi:3-deoxy-D-manno-octulosonic-acid transferase
LVNAVDVSYKALSVVIGATGRALRRGLPPAWRARLEAKPPADLESGWIWLHTVSVGEILVAEGLAGKLVEKGLRVHVTTGTAAGLELLGRKVDSWNLQGGKFSGGAFPLDDPRGLAPFLARAPALFIALETELWPGLIKALHERDVPALIVNGRLTQRSMERGGPWLRLAASRLSLVLARDPASASAFRELGAPRVELGGNLKADLPPPPRLHEGWGKLEAAWADSRVLVAGNTVEGEEDLVLEAWCGLEPSARLILAPRQPRRFQEVANLLAARNLPFRRASESWPESLQAWGPSRVLLLDTLGELAAAYRLGTLALVGGGWKWEGGHNPIEPVRWGVPTWIGPGFGNFTDLVEPLTKAGRLVIIENNDLKTKLSAKFPILPLRAGPLEEQKDGLPLEMRGALEKTWNGIQEFLPNAR